MPTYRSISFRLGILLSLLNLVHSNNAKACTKYDYQWIDLTVSTFDLASLCRNESLGCQILEDFNNYFPLLYDALGDSVTLIIPMKEVAERMQIRPISFGITHSGLPWSNWALVNRVNEGELRAVNMHFLEDEWRGPEVKLLKYDRINIPDDSHSLARLGPIKFHCESADRSD